MASPVFAQTQSFTTSTGSGFMSGFLSRYRVRTVPRLNFDDSPRLEMLMRAGTIYLSLRDAIALAIENNLDIETARYYPKLALADLQRASAGQLLRNVSTSISQGPSSASLGVLAGNNQVNSAGNFSSNTGSNGGVLSGLSVQLAGAAIPNLEPLLYVASNFTHNTNIETSTIFTGTDALIQSYRSLTYGIQQSFWSGTTVSLSLNSLFDYRQNATTALFNPIDTGSLTLSIQQNLLNGFGLAVNKRALHKAQNNLKANDLSFKQQLIATVANVVNLYYDLVNFNDDLRVKQQTLDLDTKMYKDNQRRAELGAIAPIDIIQAEAEMKSAQQDVITQESQVLQQEMILKSVITRSGLDDPTIALARIVPTDHIEVPAEEPAIPVQDLVKQAIAMRPEVEQQNINLENAQLDLLGTKNNLLPTLQAFANFSNVGQGGQAVILPPGAYSAATGFEQLTPSQRLIGGYGTVLGQIFRRDFPNYAVGFQLTVPLRNRANQADEITNELQFRQQQIQAKQLANSIKLNVMNSWTALRQARAAYEAAVEARKLQDQTLAGTRRKYELGTATITDVLVAQRDDTTRQISEKDAMDQYQRAKTNLQQTLGTILDTYDVNFQEAQSGELSRPPDPIPAVPEKPLGTSNFQ
ncbi:MAG TPA: TolC family protein [Bryobacteraceae bacterium]|nr:TolC family protein [Bryobacteraceae bacterium]